MPYADGLKQAFVGLDPLAALRAPTDALLAVNTDARDALADIGIETVADLATSPLFELAFRIGEAARGNGASPLGRLDTVPGGFAADGGPQNLAELASANLSVVRSLSAQTAAQLRDALQVETVGDLGRWLPYRSARAIMAAAIGDDGSADGAGALVPKFGEFPTERRFYSTIVMDHVSVGQTTDLTTAGPVDITPAISLDFGFSAPAVGARLTLEQSWYAHGVTLGNLLHSVALAPGESTRIAVVDWSRRTTAGATEEIGETEALAQTTAHNRAVSEVQEAVATEMQSGFSHTESTSTTKSAGGGFGFSAGPISVGGSAAIGKTKTSADSFSTSVGSRELGASMSQQVMDATQQAASSVRNRRASIVKEVSEQEHEQVSTRILANYNHMHALTVQYYEVVEVYRVRVALNEVERCLFVPMKLIDFSDDVIERFQGALADAALDRRARELLTTGYGMVRITPVAAARPFRPRIVDIAAIRTTMMRRAPEAGETPTAPEAPETPAPPPATSPERPLVFEWAADEIRRASRITGASVVRPGSEAVMLPQEATLDSINLALDSAPGISAITLRMQHGQPAIALNRTSVGFLISGAVPLEEIEEIVVTADAGSGNVTGSMTLSIGYRGSLFPVTVPVNVARGTASAVLKVGDTEAGPELVEHLRANRLHYNQAIWRSFDASTVALLLSRFTFEGRAVADLIDPRPIQIAGNYLVFRMPGFVARPGLTARFDDDDADTPEAVARRTWTDWLTSRGLLFGPPTTTEQLVPVPTGGVFAEAVLGRSNSAELLDVTRFWNWQDSPIPLQPPEIAAITMQSRAQPIDVTPGQLGQPVLNIVNPTALPDPTGVGAALSALQNGNMFRDMSGLAATIGLASETGGLATSAANESQRLAAANLAVAAQKDIEQQRIAAQVALAAMGAPNANLGTPKNISESGAVINAATARDKQKAAAGSAGGAGTGSSGFGSEGGGGGGGGGSTGGGSASGGGTGGTTDFMAGPPGLLGGDGSLGDLAFNRTLFGSLGVPAGALVLANTPGSGSGSGAARITAEVFFFSKVTKGPGLTTPAQEVEALQNSSWRPSSVDFRAIAIRSAGNRDPGADAEVATARAFLNVLGKPARRFNFFGYLFGDQLALEGEVRPNTEVGPDSSGFGPDDPGMPTIGLPTITALRELGSLSTGGGEMAELLRSVRRRNKEFSDQAQGARRELWLALASTPPTEAFAAELARALQMRVVIYPGKIVFRPDFQVNPPKVLRRGVIELFDADGPVGDKTTDLHQFDRHGIAIDP